MFTGLHVCNTCKSNTSVPNILDFQPKKLNWSANKSKRCAVSQLLVTLRDPRPCHVFHIFFTGQIHCPVTPVHVSSPMFRANCKIKQFPSLTPRTGVLPDPVLVSKGSLPPPVSATTPGRRHHVWFALCALCVFLLVLIVFVVFLSAFWQARSITTSQMIDGVTELVFVSCPSYVLAGLQPPVQAARLHPRLGDRFRHVREVLQRGFALIPPHRTRRDRSS